MSDWVSCRRQRSTLRCSHKRLTGGGRRPPNPGLSRHKLLPLDGPTNVTRTELWDGRTTRWVLRANGSSRYRWALGQKALLGQGLASNCGAWPAIAVTQGRPSRTDKPAGDRQFGRTGSESASARAMTGSDLKEWGGATQPAEEDQVSPRA